MILSDAENRHRPAVQRSQPLGEGLYRPLDRGDQIGAFPRRQRRDARQRSLRPRVMLRKLDPLVGRRPGGYRPREVHVEGVGLDQHDGEERHAEDHQYDLQRRVLDASVPRSIDSRSTLLCVRRPLAGLGGCAGSGDVVTSNGPPDLPNACASRPPPAACCYPGVMPRRRSERRRRSSTVVSSRMERITSTVAAARIVGLISWRMPAHICLGRVS